MLRLALCPPRVLPRGLCPFRSASMRASTAAGVTSGSLWNPPKRKKSSRVSTGRPFKSSSFWCASRHPPALQHVLWQLKGMQILFPCGSLGMPARAALCSSPARALPMGYCGLLSWPARPAGGVEGTFALLVRERADRADRCSQALRETTRALKNPLG